MMAERKRRKKRSVKVSRRSRHPFPGWLVVVGGQCRKVGKTALVVDLIKAFPKSQWAAVKITPYVESGCPVRGVSCECGPAEHTFTIRREKSRNGRSDTSRFHVAGAEKSIWLQTKSGRLQDALPSLVSKIGDVENVIVESNAILGHWKPDLFLLVLDPANPEFKNSARKVRRLADAFVFRSLPAEGLYQDDKQIPRIGRPKFFQPMGAAFTGNMQKFVRQRFGQIDHQRSKETGSIFS